MKIAIIGGGNMGGAIALGLAGSEFTKAENITVINSRRKIDYGSGIHSSTGDYSSLQDADIVILAVKPWLVKQVLEDHADKLKSSKQILASVAAGITLADLQQYSVPHKPLFRVMPNTAIAEKQSMTFISSINANAQQSNSIAELFNSLGKVEQIDEKLFSAATALSGCGIAYAFRYIRASMEGGIEMGLTADQSKNIVLQTLRGAIDLIEANNSHPEAEIDKVTTPGGLTIKGLNAMEHAGFTSAVIKGLKASNI